MKSKDLQLIRENINQIDKEIVSLIEKRAELSKEVAAVKAKEGLPIYYVEREQSIFEDLSTKSILGKGLKPVFTEIISLCRKNQQIFSVGVPQKEYYPALIAAKSIFGSVVKVASMNQFEMEFDYLLFPLNPLEESIVDFLLKETSIQNGILYHVKALEKNYLLVSKLIDSSAFQDKLYITHSTSSFTSEPKTTTFLSTNPSKALILNPTNNFSTNENKVLKIYHASC